MSSISEINDFHPVVSDWLTEQGYIFEHHYKLPDYGTADFVAEKNGQRFVIECKSDPHISGQKIVYQLLDYMRQVDSSHGIVAVPNEMLKKPLQKACSKHGIRCVGFDFTLPPKEKGSRNWVTDYLIEVSLAISHYGFYVEPAVWEKYYGVHPNKTDDLLYMFSEVMIDHDRRISQVEQNNRELEARILELENILKELDRGN